MSKRYSFLALIAGMIFWGSCDRRNDELWYAERQQIRDYLADNNLLADYEEDIVAGYFYRFDSPGDSSSGHPGINSTVEVHYKAYLLFDSIAIQNTYPSGLRSRIVLRDAIAAWQLAMPRFLIGARGTFIFPSRICYGERGFAPDIAPNSILRFEIELFEIHPHF